MLSRFEFPLNEVQIIFDLDVNKQRRVNGMEDAWNQLKKRVNSKNTQLNRK